MNLLKDEGFAGQISIVLPDGIRNAVTETPLINDLYLTDIGYYPSAKHHFRERRNGADEDILIYVVEGCGQVGIVDENYNLETNQFIIIPSGMAHWYRANQKNPWSIYWLHIKGKKSIYFSELHARVTTISPSKTSRIEDRIKQFNEIIEILSLGFSPDNLEYANLCLTHLMASFKYIDQYRKINFANEKDLVKRATLYMKQHVDKCLSLADIAKLLDISASHFSKLFKQRTRHSPTNYFIQLKIQHACQLLNFTQLRIHEVARAIGYEDAYYFSRIFKKVMGVSPKKYKQL